MIVQITWKRALAAIAASVVVAMTLAWSGIVNIGASTGHWAITDWFLHWAMRNTVRTYAALTVEELALDAESLISAAGHYAGACGVCHGAPGEPPSPVMRAATPPAPDLAATVPAWSDPQLFWIIKHGVKYTGMPAWPALDRDDEIRRMTAFVRRLPDMMPAQYRELAYGPGAVALGELAEFDTALADCERCHADNGRGAGDVPVLAGQKAGYLAAALDAYAAGRRASGVMSAAAAKVDPTVRRALADHYAGLHGGLRERELRAADAGADSAATDEDRLAADVVANGLPEANLPACSDCHAPGKRARYPLLSGQKPAYLAARLRHWRGDPNVADARKTNATMPVIARRIPEELIEPLADYFARQ